MQGSFKGPWSKNSVVFSGYKVFSAMFLETFFFSLNWGSITLSSGTFTSIGECQASICVGCRYNVPAFIDKDISVQTHPTHQTC